MKNVLLGLLGILWDISGGGVVVELGYVNRIASWSCCWQGAGVSWGWFFNFPSSGGSDSEVKLAPPWQLWRRREFRVGDCVGQGV